MSEPTFRERMKPAEYLGFSGIAGLFTFLIAFVTSRQLMISVILALVAFVVCVVVVATLLLVVNKDIDKQRMEEELAAERNAERGAASADPEAPTAEEPGDAPRA